MPKRKKGKKSHELAAAEELPHPHQTPTAIMLQEPHSPHLHCPPEEETQQTTASRKPPGKPKKPIPKKKLAAIQEKLSLLNQNLRPFPFSPTLDIDISTHERLLRALGLWDFAHLHLDRHIRSDLLSLLIANYDPPNRRSSVNGARISVSRADLARALSLPVKKEKSNNPTDSDIDLFSGEETASVIGGFISNQMVFLEDAAILPVEVVLANRLVKEGQPNKVDWAGMMWAMVEKELLEAPKSGICYYASHLQCLMKHQRPKLFEEVTTLELELEPEPEPEPEQEPEPSTEVATVEEEDDTKDIGDMGRDNHGPGLSLGLGRDVEESKKGEEEQWVSDGKDAGMSIEHCLQRCSLNDVMGTMENEDLSKGEGDGGGREEDGYGNDLATKFPSLERLNSTDLLQAMDTGNSLSFNPSLHPALDPSNGEFLAMGSETHKSMALDPGPGGSLLFGNDHKRAIDEIDEEDDDNGEDVRGLPHSNQQKRFRSDVPWEHTPSVAAFDGCFEQVQCWMGKARMVLVEKEQTYMNAQLQLQYLNGVLQQKDQIIQSMEKTRMEELQKRQIEVCRFEHELGAISSVLFGYKKALKDTRNAFAEYRKKFPLGNEPLYRDGGGTGDVVLGSRELGKQCLEKEEEAHRIAVEMINDFKKSWFAKLANYGSCLSQSATRLVELKEEFKLLKERFAETKDQNYN